MRGWIRLVTAALVVAAMGATGMPASAPAHGERAEAEAAAAAGRAGPAGVLPPGGRWTVTLLTGEVVEVASDADGRVSARVREHDEPFRLLRLPDGEVHVIPLAVTGLLDGVLDPELFNVTGLVRQGYDDEGLSSVPLIVEREPGTDVRARVASADERPLPSIGAVAVEVPKADTGAAQALLDQLAVEATPGARVRPSGVTRVWLDRRVTLSRADQVDRADRPAQAARSVSASRAAAPMQEPRLDDNLTQIGADDAWEAGFTGEGVTVAVLDTGVDATHPDLAGRVGAEQNFSDATDGLDHFGHGTHVAALAAGTGAGAAGARRGVAPDARLISGKVVDDFGFGFESQAIAGMEWAAPQADVVNMSLGYGLGSDGSDPISVALDNLSEQHGTLFVVAAGNWGPASRSVDFPGVADRALTVGAVDGDDALADFSSRGPVDSSFELKPEVVAPGVDIVAARAAGTAMGEPVDDRYTVASGTSMAAPHVAGAAAVLAQEHPDWDADELKNTIVGSAAALDDDGYDVGAGRLDVGLGVASVVRPGRDAVEASLPEPRTEPGTEVLTWANDGDEPVTVALDATLEDRRGGPVDEVSVEPAELTIAPHATATATLTIDGPDLDTGLYTGAVTATAPGDEGGGETVRTPVAVHAAAETVDLTIAATSPAGGSATPRTFAAVVNLDDYGAFGMATGFQGDSLTLPVPAGRYAVVGDVSSADRDENAVAQVGDPEVTVDGDTTVAFDGAAAQPLRPRIEGVDTAPPMYASANLQITPAAGTEGSPLVTEVYSWRPMPAVLVTPMEGDAEHFAASQTYRLQAPHLTVRVGDEAIPVADVDDAHLPALGEHAYVAVDAGDGGDLSAARGRVAVVSVAADRAERAAVTRRAADAGVAVLAFVDEARRFLTLNAGGPGLPELHWADVPVVVATGDGASRLRAAAANGDALTVTVAASPDVYDIVGPDAARVDPEPMISRSEQRRLATISERFHRDADGTGTTADSRYSEINLMDLGSAGPLPERRTSHVSPGVRWQSMAVAPAVAELFGELVTVSTAVSMDEGRTYEPGSRHRVTWVRRPQWPGPVGDIPRGLSFCQSTPVVRTADLLQVWLSAFQDRLDGFGCGSALEGSSLTLERDGQVVPERDESDFPIPDAGEFPIPPEPGNYRLTYEGVGQSPYVHRSTTTWTFRSAAPPGDERALIPLLVVGYQLPLDTLNRPTGDAATLTVRQVTGAPESPVRRVRAWTSTDDGATWRPAPVERREGSEYGLRLPRAARGTGISLRVSASDAAGATIDQTLIDAYTA